MVRNGVPDGHLANHAQKLIARSTDLAQLMGPVVDHSMHCGPHMNQ